jgi:L-rhamnonate dehydratase
MAEYWMGTDPGVPLEETVRIPGTSVPVRGKVTPSSEPGFGMEFEPSDISDWGSN